MCTMTSSRFSGLIGLGAHLRVFVVLVAEHHHGDQASAVLLVVD
jgi:hypothetical protein